MRRKSQKYPFITVVIPAFNEEKYLSNCLSALQKQAYPKENYEVIVVDNNSTDKTGGIASRFGIEVVNVKQQGYVFALAEGMRKAKGEIVAVTDADTIVSKDWLAKIARVFKDKDVVGVTGSTTTDSDSKMVNLLARFFYMVFLKCTFTLGRPNLSGNNMAVARRAFALVNGIDTRFEMSPDVDLGLRLKNIGKIRFETDLFAVTSARRFRKGFFRAILEYAKGYIFVAWLRRPPNFEQTTIR